MRVYYYYDIPFYREVVKRVSLFALNEVHKQLVIAKRPSTEADPLCTSGFSASMGLPCAHTIRAKLATNQILHLEDFHFHWKLTNPTPATILILLGEPPKPATLELLLASINVTYQQLAPHQQQATHSQLSQLSSQTKEVSTSPAVARTRGRPQGSSNREGPSTRRDPSAFERIGRT